MREPPEMGPEAAGDEGLPAASVFLILGLGNPGPEYAMTRHNLGFMVVDELAARHGLQPQERTRLALVGPGRIRDQRVVLAKPRTYMNLSGQAAQSLAARFQVPPQRLLALVDDFTIPLGRVRLRKDGGSGGHNGLASLLECLGTRDFPRLRLGIGPLPPGTDQVDFVLGPFEPAQEEARKMVVQRGADAVECFLEHGLESAMNQFNGSPS